MRPSRQAWPRSATPDRAALGRLEPAGTYTVLVALTQPGTLNVIGTIREVSFTFTP